MHIFPLSQLVLYERRHNTEIPLFQSTFNVLCLQGKIKIKISLIHNPKNLNRQNMEYVYCNYMYMHIYLSK